VTYELNLAKVFGLFTPLWVLLALSLWVHWDSWQAEPWWLAPTIGLPVLFVVLAWTFGRRRWRVELTPTELIHHTLGRTERYDFARMGPVEVSKAPLPEPIGVLTVSFAWPVDPDLGAGSVQAQLKERRILGVFGDGPTRRLADEIELWRRRALG